jgi:RNA polymerase sigma-70 factor (ECF subfamily)
MVDWEQLFRDHSAAMWSAIYRLVPHSTDAEECFQQAWFAACEIAQKEAVQSWPALLRWLATVHALQRQRRKRYLQSLVSTIDVDQLIDDPGAKPSARLEAKELAAQLRRALTTISPRQAEVFCLICLEERSYSEVATMLGLSINHVGVLLSRARAALQQQLDTYRASANLP